MAASRAKVMGAAEKLVRQGKLQEAIRLYRAISEDNPRDVNTINRIGDLFVRLRRHQDAIKQFIRIADFYASDGFNLKAIAMYKKITKLDPNHPEANEKLAELYAKQGLVIEARTQYLALADGLLRASKSEEAIAVYQKILGLESGNLKVRLKLGELLGRTGKESEAVDELLAVAGELKNRKMMEEAFKVLQKASALRPTHAGVLKQMVEVAQADGRDPSEIIDTLEGLATAEPGDSGVLHTLAQAYLSSGRLQDFEKLASTASNPASKLAMVEAQARHHLAEGDREKGLDHLSEAAECAMENGDPERSVALLEQVLEVAPRRVEAIQKLLDISTRASDRAGMINASEKLARLHCEEENWKEATQALESLQTLDPENQVAEELLPRLPVSPPPAEGRPSEEEAATVPSLEDLEKVVDLDMESEVSLTPEPPSLESTAELEEESSFGSDSLPISTPSLSPEATLSEGTLDSEPTDLAPSPATDFMEPDTLSPLETSGPNSPPPLEPGVTDLSSRPLPEPPIEVGIDEDFLSEHFTEAEVFLKYGLVEKAQEQLDTILGRYPDHVPSWAKIKQMHLEAGDPSRAAEACMKLALIHRKKGEESLALEREREAKELKTGAQTSAPPVAEGPGEALPESSLEELVSDLPPSPDPEPFSSSEPISSHDLGTVEPESEEELTIEMVEDEMPAASIENILDEEKLSEFDFYLRQGLLEEAENILASLEASNPGHETLVPRRLRLDETRSGKRPSEETESSDPNAGAGPDLDLDVERVFGGDDTASTPDPQLGSSEEKDDEDFFDLASELREQDEKELSGATETVALEPPAGEEANLDDVFRAFRKKVDEEVGEGDFETRYNLGIAYKEMGLLDEAIGEFQYSSRDPQLFLESCSILGICFKEKGMLDLAVKWYQKALDSPGHPEEDYQGLRYDLAELYVERGEFSEALALFSEVYGVNSNYRDVTARVKELRKRVG